VVGGKYGTTLGDRVTVGHNAVVHGCVVEDGR
jgi:carbonic anhydrase/acetyltransferase-like protein (isoleucine patch superfamily)